MQDRPCERSAQYRLPQNVPRFDEWAFFLSLKATHAASCRKQLSTRESRSAESSAQQVKKVLLWVNIPPSSADNQDDT